MDTNASNSSLSTHHLSGWDGSSLDVKRSAGVATRTSFMRPLDAVGLTPLMNVSSGRPEIRIGLVDGPIVTTHTDLASDHLVELPGSTGGKCADVASAACTHGTFVAGMLIARRGSGAPAICPDCTLVVRPIFSEQLSNDAIMPNATGDELTAAIVECVEAGVRVLNLSSALVNVSMSEERRLEDALDYAARHGVIVIAAAGNQGNVGSSAITRHHTVIAVAGCETLGRPLSYSNLGISIGRRGLSAPGDEVTSLAPAGSTTTSSGTSVAAPFVSGAVALIWSQFPSATASDLRRALNHVHDRRRRGIVPPLLDAWATYLAMASTSRTTVIA